MRAHVRWIGAAAVLLASLGATAGVAGAEPPVGPAPIPEDPTEDDIPAADGCGDFDVILDPVGGKVGGLFFRDGRAFFFAPGLKLRLTNSETGTSMVINATGGFHDGPWADLPPTSVTFRSTFTGHNLLFGKNSDTGVGQVLYIVGRGTTTFNLDLSDGQLSFADLDTSRARVTDICVALR